MFALQPVRFQLNHASAKGSGAAYSDREFSIWVTDLSDDVTEKDLAKTFDSRYESVKAVKIVRDSKKPFGFVRFTEQNDQREALIHMNGFRGLGDNPIRVSIAVPKSGLDQSSARSAGLKTDFGHYYEHYWSDRGAWGNYGSYKQQQNSQNSVLLTAASTKADHDLDLDEEERSGDDERLVDPHRPINVDAMNTEFVTRSEEAWDAAERDRWIYALDSDVDGAFVPNFKKRSNH